MGIRIDGLPESPDQRHASAQRHEVAELVARRAIGSSQLLLLAPNRAAPHKHVRGSLSAILVHSPDQRRVPAHRHGVAEEVASRAIGCGQFLLQAPYPAALDEHVRGPLEIDIRIRSDGFEGSPDQQSVPTHRDGNAELVVRRAIGSSQLLLLAPCSAALREHVRRPLEGILARSRDHRRAPADRHEVAEIVARRAVGSGQLLL